ncbi:hypothetical protein [Rhizobium rhizogenes]|uniref:hypothetical protein n=1 Tax=Rhizobium rhizogenes TaxID=359 RepID=UPI0015741F7F|nr:hypothetical protein [Rhizobium rhizogenes]NTF63418.1 hypothetical protein [Rhizobium rhizogenes]NTG94750.1 hypothetical protein [Rhizobium rhizogenes]
MKLSTPLAGVLFLVFAVSGAQAEQGDVYLFLDPPSVKTKVDAISADLRGEFVDQDLTKRDVVERPRFSLSCKDNKSQFLSLYLPADLNPWSNLKDGGALKGNLKSDVGSFSEFTGNLRASPLNAGLSIVMDVGTNASAIGRVWYDSMAITLNVVPEGDLPDLNLVLFAAETSSSFKSELATAVKACELLSST